jgi:hypothetical protein
MCHILGCVCGVKLWIKVALIKVGGDGLAVNMSGQHVCVLRVRVPLPPPCGGILTSDMAYGVVR